MSPDSFVMPATVGRPAFGRRDPDARGYFGSFGGRFVPETLMAPLAALDAAYFEARADAVFVENFRRLLHDYVGRPTPLTDAERLARGLGGGVRILLKREDLAHTGAHKINNALGQALLAQRMGKRRIVAETGAGQHGVATATVCALLGLHCVVYMGTEDMERQALNVFRMRLLGADVQGVEAGSRTLKDAINEAMRDWVANVSDTHYLLGSALGPHPYPLMVREFQSVIGDEARAQCLAQTGRLPDVAVACVGGGSNAMGLFDAFVADRAVRLVGIEAGGEAILSGRHAARFAGGSPGILQGTRTFVLQDEAGNIALTHSVSAGLDYAAVGPEHAWLRETGRADYLHVSDDEALAAFEGLAKDEGILPALESSHAFAALPRVVRDLPEGGIVLVNLSGRGDKDVQTVARALQARGAAVPAGIVDVREVAADGPDELAAGRRAARVARRGGL
jgi:tryptophan synthase beta chain